MLPNLLQLLGRGDAAAISLYQPGSVVARGGCPQTQDDLLALAIGELDRQLMLDSRAANRYLSDRRPELYGALNQR